MNFIEKLLIKTGRLPGKSIKTSKKKTKEAKK